MVLFDVLDLWERIRVYVHSVEFVCYGGYIGGYRARHSLLEAIALFWKGLSLPLITFFAQSREAVNRTIRTINMSVQALNYCQYALAEAGRDQHAKEI
jgi:hypothetical protein